MLGLVAAATVALASAFLAALVIHGILSLGPDDPSFPVDVNGIVRWMVLYPLLVLSVALTACGTVAFLYMYSRGRRRRSATNRKAS